MAKKLVVLGVCEAGKSRHSVSDEPLGFPGILIQSGVKSVIAPLWKVDDLVSAIFITKLFENILNHHSTCIAFHKTTSWLRELTAEKIENIVQCFIVKLNQLPLDKKNQEFIFLNNRLNEYHRWIKTLNKKSKNLTPFRGSLDCAAFEFYGKVNFNMKGMN